MMIMLTSRIYQGVLMRNARNDLRRILETQYWSEDRIREEQLRKIRELLHHAYHHVPYYTELFKNIGAHPEDIRSLELYSKLPVLTKAIIRENSGNLAANNAKAEDRIANATGGSTGEPLQFLQDRRYLNAADAARLWGWHHVTGCKIGDLSAILWGAVRDIKSDFALSERLRDFLTLGEMPLNAFNLSEDRMHNFLKWCKAFRPRILRGYVSAVREFASYLERNNIRLKGLRAVILCAEAVDPTTQSYIERVYGVQSFNSYGGRELSLTAIQCAASSELHEVSLNNYVEFADPPDPTSTRAKMLIVTNLNNYTMPFIRYEIGDLGMPGTPGPCSCGRGLPRIKSVVGRTTEILSFGEGTRIAGEMFIHMMKELSLGEYQFVQKASNLLVLRTIKAISDEQKNAICKLYSPLLPSGVTMDFQQVSAFPKTPTGKFRFVYCELDSSNGSLQR